MTNHKSWRQIVINKSRRQLTNQRTSHLLSYKGCTSQDSRHFGGRGGDWSSHQNILTVVLMTLAIWSSWAHIDIIRQLKTTTIEIITTSNVTIMYCHFHHNNYQEHFFFIEGKPQSLHSWLRHHHEAVFFILTHSREATAEPYESHADAHHFLIAPIFFFRINFDICFSILT